MIEKGAYCKDTKCFWNGKYVPKNEEERQKRKEMLEKHSHYNHCDCNNCNQAKEGYCLILSENEMLNKMNCDERIF